MATKSRFLLPALLLVCVVVVLYRIQAIWMPLAVRQTQPVEHDVHGLVVSTQQLDIGDHWEQKRFVRELPIQNRTSQPITIKQFQTSCGCLSVEPKSLIVPAGETATVTLAFDTSHRAPNDVGKPIREFLASVEPIIDRVGGGSGSIPRPNSPFGH